MDAQGVDLQVLSSSPPGTHPPARTQCRSPRSPTTRRRRPSAGIRPVPRTRNAAARESAGGRGELERAFGLGFVGHGLRTGGDTPLDDHASTDLLEAAAALRTPIFIHPQIPSRAPGLRISGFDPTDEPGPGHLRLGLAPRGRARRVAPDRPRHVRSASGPAADSRPLGRTAAVLAGPCR